jgi:ferredoxin--NADP+ reductase
MGIPGEDKANVYGACAFVGWFNGHPDYRDLDPDLDVEAAAVVGNGNVALDIARVLAKTPEEMATSDLAEPARRAIHGSPLTDIHVLGRRGPAQAKFSNPELSEIVGLADALPRVEPPELPEAAPGYMSDRERRQTEKNLATFRRFMQREPDGEHKRIHFTFYAKPLEVLGGEKVEGLRLARTRVDDAGRVEDTDETFEIACGLLVSAIGYRTPALEDLPFDTRAGHFQHEDGRIDDGLYVAGWCGRGPQGVIGTNKADGDAAARRIVESETPGGKRGGEGLERLLAERGVRWVDFDDWRAIDAAERAAAPEEAPRRKFLCVEDMLKVLDRDANRQAAGTKS